MHLNSPQTFCTAGVARRDVTPPVGIYHRMWGAATHERSTGVHRPLTATALALAPQTDEGASAEGIKQQAQIVVAVDHCLWWSDELDNIRASVAGQLGLNVDQLHVALSHTHASGLMERSRSELPGGDLIAPYLELLTQRIGEAAAEALAALQPVRIVYGTGRCTLAAQRDFWDAQNEAFACGFNPAGIADDAVLVARVTDARSHTLATVVNYACHPTTLAWDNTLISPDYLGAMRELVENATGAPCVFLQGASGDLGPRHGYVGDTAVADRNGRVLGHAALAALESLGPPGTRFEYTGPVVSGATVGTWDYRPLPSAELRDKHRWQSTKADVELPYRSDLPSREQTESELARWQHEEQAALERGDTARARDCRAQAERMSRQLSRLQTLPPGDHVEVACSLWRAGDAFWLFVAGEYYNLLQRSLRERFAEHPILIATVTDGWRPGYVPTADTYGKGIYQESIAVVAPGSLEKLIQIVGDKIAAWCK